MESRGWSAAVASLLCASLLAGGCGTDARRDVQETRRDVEKPRPDMEDTGPDVEFTSSELSAYLDLPFSEVARHGDLLFLSGMIGIEPGTTNLVSGGLEAEARRALENIRLMLAEVGAAPSDVLRCTIMMDDIDAWARFNEVYTEFFGEHRPARSAFGADGLALGAAVEIECVASRPAGGG